MITDILSDDILQFLANLEPGDLVAEQHLVREFSMPFETAEVIISQLCRQCRRQPRYAGKSLCRVCINAARKQYEQAKRNERTGFMTPEEYEASQGE